MVTVIGNYCKLSEKLIKVLIKEIFFIKRCELLCF